MAGDLITATRAKYNLLGETAFSSDEDSLIDDLIDGCSQAIQKFCRREFISTQFDQLYPGPLQDLILREFPIISVNRVASCPEAVLDITNTSTSNQRATAAVTSSGLTLVRVASGVTTTDSTIDWATYTTLTAVANQVASLGNGWAASVRSGFGDWPSAYLRSPQGAFNVKNTYGSFELHTKEETLFDLIENQGIIRVRSGWDYDQWPYSELDPPNGATRPNYYRVVYTAGFASVPEDVQEACAEWVAWLFNIAKRDPSLRSNANSDLTSSSVSNSYRDLQNMPGHVRQLLLPWRKISM